MRKYLAFLFLSVSLSAVAQTPLNTSNGVKTLGSQYTGDFNVNQNWGGTGMSGMYLFNAQTYTNAPLPSSDWYHVIEMQHDNSNNWIGQIALGYFTDGMYYRQQHDGNIWGNWHTVATQDWSKSNLLSQSGPALIKYGSSTEYIIQHQDTDGNMIFGFKRGTPIDGNDLLMRSWAGYGFATANSENIKMRIDASGRIGIGITQPSALLHINGTGTSKDATNQYNGDFIIQGNTGSRSAIQGAQLEFVIPANTDGSNPWGQGRIITVAGNSNNYNATGKMILGTRRSFSKTGGNPTWNYGDDIVIDGSGNVGIGTIIPSEKLSISGGSLLLDNARWYAGKNASGTTSPLLGIGSDNNIYMGDLFGNIPNNNLILRTNGSDKMTLAPNGNVGIGTTNPQSKLAVNGVITTKEVNVTATGWADYVFDSSYELKPLAAVASYIQENKHLPNIPSAEDVSKNGISLGEMNKKLLEKVEELTLYAIRQNEQIKELRMAKEEYRQQKELIEKLQQRLEELENKK